MLLVRSFASTGTPRPELTGVYVQKDRVAATDAYTLAEVRVKEAEKPEEFPIMPNLPRAKDLDTPFIMPANVAEAISKAIPKPHKSLPILSNAAYLGADANGNVTYATTDLETVKAATFRPIDGKYPEYAPIIPTKAPLASVRVSAEYLLRAAKMLQEFNKTEGRLGLNDITVEFHGNGDPMVLKAGVRKLEATILIMPIKQ